MNLQINCLPRLIDTHLAFSAIIGMDPSGPIFETNSNGDLLNNKIIIADINKLKRDIVLLQRNMYHFYLENLLGKK